MGLYIPIICLIIFDTGELCWLWLKGKKFICFNSDYWTCNPLRVMTRRSTYLHRLNGYSWMVEKYGSYFLCNLMDDHSWTVSYRSLVLGRDPLTLYHFHLSNSTMVLSLSTPFVIFNCSVIARQITIMLGILISDWAIYLTPFAAACSWN